MVSKRTMIVMLVLDIYGLVVALACALAAEIGRKKLPIAAVDAGLNFCFYGSGSGMAAVFAIIAIQSLVCGHIAITQSSYHKGMGFKQSYSRVWVAISLMTCWVTLLDAEGCEIVNSAKKSKLIKYRTSSATDSFDYIKTLVFGVSAISIIADILCDICYIYHLRANATSELQIDDTDDNEELKNSLIP